MAEKKGIHEEAMTDLKKIQNALDANTKEILRSIAKEEIDSVVKESLLIEDDFEEVDIEDEEGEEGIVDAPVGDDAAEAPISDLDIDGDDDVVDDIVGSDEVAPEMEPEVGMDADALGGEEIDMTASSDDEVISIYKKLSGEDEIEIVDDEIHLSISEPGEYVVKTGGTDLGEPIEEPSDLDIDTDIPMGDEEEVSDLEIDDAAPIDGGDGDQEYEIEMGDEEEGGEEGEDLDLDSDSEEEEEEEELAINEGEEIVETEEITEDEITEEDVAEGEDAIEEKDSIGTGMSVGNHTNKYATGSLDTNENPKRKTNESTKAKAVLTETIKKHNTLLTEAKALKAENEQFREALKDFRTKLVETVVFNSNLTYTTRLFMEHATTKTEKEDIIKRFDTSVSNLKESKKLYKTIEGELNSKKPINEAVNSKINTQVSTSISKQLNESTAYVDPSTKRIQDLINRVEKR